VHREEKNLSLNVSCELGVSGNLGGPRRCVQHKRVKILFLTSAFDPQGITLETIKAAENICLSDERRKKFTDDQDQQEAPTTTRAVAGPAEKAKDAQPVAPLENSVKQTTALARLSANLNSTLKNLDEFTASPMVARERDKFAARFIPAMVEQKEEACKPGAGQSASGSSLAVSGSVRRGPACDALCDRRRFQTPAAAVKAAPEPSLATSRARRTRGSRRSTGPIAPDDVSLAAGDSSAANPGDATASAADDKENRRQADAAHRFASRPVFAAYTVSLGRGILTS